jgi:hypothetical protein
VRRTLVDLLERDIARDDVRGPDWLVVTEDAVLRQDMDWLLAQPRERVEQPVSVDKVDLAGPVHP